MLCYRRLGNERRDSRLFIGASSQDFHGYYSLYHGNPLPAFSLKLHFMLRVTTDPGRCIAATGLWIRKPFRVHTPSAALHLSRMGVILQADETSTKASSCRAGYRKRILCFVGKCETKCVVYDTLYSSYSHRRIKVLFAM